MGVTQSWEERNDVQVEAAGDPIICMIMSNPKAGWAHGPLLANA